MGSEQSKTVTKTKTVTTTYRPCYDSCNPRYGFTQAEPWKPLSAVLNKRWVPARVNLKVLQNTDVWRPFTYEDEEGVRVIEVPAYVDIPDVGTVLLFAWRLDGDRKYYAYSIANPLKDHDKGIDPLNVKHRTFYETPEILYDYRSKQTKKVVWPLTYIVRVIQPEDEIAMLATERGTLMLVPFGDLPRTTDQDIHVAYQAMVMSNPRHASSLLVPPKFEKAPDYDVVKSEYDNDNEEDEEGRPTMDDYSAKYPQYARIIEKDKRFSASGTSSSDSSSSSSTPSGITSLPTPGQAAAAQIGSAIGVMGSVSIGHKRGHRHHGGHRHHHHHHGGYRPRTTVVLGGGYPAPIYADPYVPYGAYVAPAPYVDPLLSVRLGSNIDGFDAQGGSSAASPEPEMVDHLEYDVDKLKKLMIECKCGIAGKQFIGSCITPRSGPNKDLRPAFRCSRAYVDPNTGKLTIVNFKKDVHPNIFIAEGKRLASEEIFREATVVKGQSIYGNKELDARAIETLMEKTAINHGPGAVVWPTGNDTISMKELKSAGFGYYSQQQQQQQAGYGY